MKKKIRELYSVKSVVKHLAETLEVESPIYQDVTNLYNRVNHLLQKETTCLGTITVCLKEAETKQNATRKLMRQSSKNQAHYQRESSRLTQEIKFLTDKKNKLTKENRKQG